MVALGERPQTDIEWAGRARMAMARLSAQPVARARLATAETRLAEEQERRAERRDVHWSSQEMSWSDYYRALTRRDLCASMAASVDLDDTDREAITLFPQR